MKQKTSPTQEQIAHLLEHKLTVLEEAVQATRNRDIVTRGLVALQLQAYLRESYDWWNERSANTVHQWIEQALEDLKSKIKKTGIPQNQNPEPTEGYVVQLDRAFR